VFKGVFSSFGRTAFFISKNKKKESISTWEKSKRLMAAFELRINSDSSNIKNPSFVGEHRKETLKYQFWITG